MSASDEKGNCYRFFRKIQARSIEEDDFGKAKSFQICSIRRPHMRGFHTSWFGFFIAFTAWFGIQPLIPTIRKELGLSKTEIAQSGIASISATILVRVVVGPLCDKYGPRRVMSGLLIIGSTPLAFSGLIKNGTGLIIVRLCIGILGGAFVPCQFWTSAMFNVKIVGTANALVGGWGNLGGGFTFLFMPALFEIIKLCGADEFLAWKIALVIPAVIVSSFGILIIWTSDDCPQGDWSLRKLPEKNKLSANVKYNGENCAPEEKQQLEHDYTAPEISEKETDCDDEKDDPCFKRFWLIVTVMILMTQYGLSFGIEIAVNTVMNLYFLYKFKKDDCVEEIQDIIQTNATTVMTMSTIIPLSDDPNRCSILSQNTASLIASLFGLTNLFARALGGIFSDLLRKCLRIPGRILAHMICMIAAGLLLIAFSHAETIPSAIIIICALSLFIQMTEGTTFAIVPYVYPRRVGVIAGLTGAGGNAGAMIWNTLWLQMVEDDPSNWFLLLGICVLCGSMLPLFIRVQRQRIWSMFVK